jgi:3-oxoacyl-[acyl-carrier-protein] synthase-1/3-oxoacyl-[acyl-carrier-protein] synthase II
MSARVIAIGAVSALGIGEAAYRVTHEGEPARVALARDEVLAAAGLARPLAGRAPADLRPASASASASAPASVSASASASASASVPVDRAAELLGAALRQLTDQLDVVRPDWQASRLGLAVGTSSGGMLSAERFFAARATAPGAIEPELARAATYFAPLDRALADAGLTGAFAQRTQVLAACAASTIAIGIGGRWLERGACDLVIAGGYDGLSVFVAAGFEALKATTASSVRPFRVGRDGMALGEGAGLLALVRADDELGGAKAIFHVAGFGASTDAVHITAPDRTGGGLARAASAALADADVAPERVGLVSAHATATPYNDAMEAKAIASALGASARPVVHPFKAQIGHTLGAAGALETLAAVDALRRGVAPAAAGEGELDPEAPALLLPRAERRPLEVALKLSAAFGGANAALVITTAEPSARPPRPLREVGVSAFAHVTDADLGALCELTGVARDRLARLDPLGRLGLSAVAALAAKVGRETLRGAGIVVGHGLATLDTNAMFDTRKRERGARMVEPRLFPATSPNAVGGECAIVYGMTGPSFAVAAGLDGGMEALARAAELCAAGDADRVVVLAVDDLGPAAHDLLRAAGWEARDAARGAVAALLEPLGPTAARGVDLDVHVDHDRGGVGHLPLLRWLSAG